MGPVRIKYYGLFWLTQRTYLKLQFIALLICIALMVIGLAVMWRTGQILPHVPDPRVEDDFFLQGMILLFWAGLLGLIAESIETIMVLRKFARARAEQQIPDAALVPGGSAPPAPSSTAVQPPPDERPNTNIQP
jgi:hypothetical protein